MAAPGTELLVTCEHGGNVVPREYRKLFRGRGQLLASHRGHDIGAGAAARWLSRELGCPLVCASVTRLLVDLNRSPGHPALFSELTRQLPAAERERILTRYYHPYRGLVSAWIAARIAGGGRLIHLSVHSFTPRLAGHTRETEVGLLYDPARRAEVRFCREWQERFVSQQKTWRLRRNYPYRGTSDGQVVALRRSLPAARYIGIELEINQRLLARSSDCVALCRALVGSLPVESTRPA